MQDHRVRNTYTDLHCIDASTAMMPCKILYLPCKANILRSQKSFVLHECVQCTCIMTLQGNLVFLTNPTYGFLHSFWAKKGNRTCCMHAGKLQAVAQAYAIFFSIGSLAVQLHALCVAAAFTGQYADRVHFPIPVHETVSKPLWLHKAVMFLAGIESQKE